MSSLEKMSEAIMKALDDNNVEEVLSVLAGSFVALTVEVIRRNGNDPDMEIHIDDASNDRAITIHAVKDNNGN